MRGPLRLLLIGVVALVVLAGVGVAALFLFFPPERVRALVLAEAEKASGYELTLGDARLAWSAGGVVIRLRELAARSADRTQEIAAPAVDLQVELWPLLRRVVTIRRLEVTGLDLHLLPPAAGLPPTGTPPTGTPHAGTPPAVTSPAPSAAEAAGVLTIPVLRITGGRLVQESPDGVNRADGFTLDGRFSARGAVRTFEGQGTAASFVLSPARGGETRLTAVTLAGRFDGQGTAGTFRGDIAADSLRLLLPGASGKPPLRLAWPGPRSRVEVALELGSAPSARTGVNGRLGPLPFSGEIESRPAAGTTRWTSRGHLDLSAVALDSLKALLPAEALEPLRVYALGGRLEATSVTFATRPAGDTLDYRLATRITGITAALPEKGRVIDDGAVDLTAHTGGLSVSGRLQSGSSRLDIDATAGAGERAPWQAHVTLRGPAAEALRFLPPEGAPSVTAGRLDLDLRLTGRVGDTALPAAAGRVELLGVAGTHPALAVPLSAFDLRASFSGDRAVIESGQLTAGKSRARFSGTVQNLAKPVARLDIDAGDVVLDELFPEPAAASAPAPASARGGGGAPPPAVPISGRVRIARLIRQKLTLSDLTADYDMGPAGMRMQNVSAAAYGGRVSGDLTLKPKGAEALDYSGRLEVADARLGELLGAVSKIRGLDGRIETTMTLSGQNGPAVNPLMALSLDARALVIEGALVNLPAVRKIAEALSFQNAASDAFPFQSLRSRFRVTNGFVTFDSCTVRQAGADWTLGGRIGLDGTLDLPMTAQLSTAQFQPGSELRKVADLLAGPEGRIPVALRLTGTLTDPKVSVDLDPLLRQVRDKAKGAAAEELKKRIGGLFKKP